MKSCILFFVTIFSFSLSAQWTAKSNFPGTPRWLSASFNIADKGYVAFGVDGPRLSNPTYYNDLWEFDPATNAWSMVSTFPNNVRSEAIAFTTDSNAYLGLGWNGSTTFKDLLRYDPLSQTWDTLTNYPGDGGRNSFYATTNNKAYIGGGSTGTSTPYENDFWEYNISNDTWVQRGNLPFGSRTGGVSFAIDSNIYFGMGHDGTVDYNDLWAYNTNTNTWSNKAALPGSPRLSPIFFVLNGKAIVGGGHRLGSNVGIVESDYYEYTPSTNSWRAITNSFTDSTRAYSTGFAIGANGYIFGGTSNYPNVLNDLWEYNSQTVSIPKNTLEELFVKLYPSPNSGQFIIELNTDYQDENGSILRVYDNQGRLVQEKILNALKNEINIGDCPSGLYHYTIQNSQSIKTGLFSVMD